MRHMRLQVENELFAYYKIIMIIIVKERYCAVHVKMMPATFQSELLEVKLKFSLIFVLFASLPFTNLIHDKIFINFLKR